MSPPVDQRLREICRQALLAYCGPAGVGWSWEQLRDEGWSERVDSWVGTYRGDRITRRSDAYLAGRFLRDMIRAGHLTMDHTMLRIARRAVVSE